MTTTHRIWLLTCTLCFALIAVVQLVDCWRWATGPWLGFTIRDEAILSFRTPHDLPEPLRPLAAGRAGRYGGGEHLRARRIVFPDGDALDLTGFGISDSRLRGRLAPGDLVRLEGVTAAGATFSAPIQVRTVPLSIVLARGGCYPGIGLLVAVFGLLVHRGRPASPQAIAFLVLSLVFGVELLAGQVAGGFPSRFQWLKLMACYATPAAAASLALVLGPRAWTERRPWLQHLPWVAAASALMGAMALGVTHDDLNPLVRMLRLSGWAFFTITILIARFKATSPEDRRRAEYYLAGMALAFALPAYHYGLRSAEPAPPQVMLTLLLLPLVIGFGIVQHRLFDIQLVLRRGAALGVMLLLLAVYGVAVVFASQQLGPGIGTSPAWTGGLVISAVALGSVLRDRVQRLVDRGIAPERFRYLEVLREASRELSRMDGDREIADYVVETLVTRARLESATLFVSSAEGLTLSGSSGAGAGLPRTPPSSPVTHLAADEPLVGLLRLLGAEILSGDFDENPRLAAVAGPCRARMSELGAALVLPLLVGKDRLVGLLALGPRRDGVRFNVEDLDLLRTLANHAASAVDRSRSSEWTLSRAGTPAVIGPGTAIAHYQVERLVGRGGMGLVFLATDSRLGRRVALKLLPDDVAEDPIRVEQLRREARLLATLNHPNIMLIHSLDEAAGHVFIVAEYIEGTTLREELEKRGRFPADEALAIATVLARALGHALSQGVLHRDVKLSNAMRSAAGIVKLTDFGLARPLATTDVSLTGTGRVVGTLAYLAPELLRGEKASFASDMYALGVCIHQLVTGRGVWEGGTKDPWAAMKTAADPAVLLSRGVPAAAVAAMGRLLALAPEERFPDYAALETELERIRRTLGAPG